MVKKYNISNRYIYVLIYFFFKKNYEKLRIGYGIWNVELWVLLRIEKLIIKSEIEFFDSFLILEKSSCFGFCYVVYLR